MNLKIFVKHSRLVSIIMLGIFRGYCKINISCASFLQIDFWATWRTKGVWIMTFCLLILYVLFVCLLLYFYFSFFLVFFQHLYRYILIWNVQFTQAGFNHKPPSQFYLNRCFKVKSPNRLANFWEPLD